MAAIGLDNRKDLSRPWAAPTEDSVGCAVRTDAPNKLKRKGK